MTGFAPLTSRDSVNVPELTQQMFDVWKVQNKNSSYFVEQKKRLSWSLGLASASVVALGNLGDACALVLVALAMVPLCFVILRGADPEQQQVWCL